MQSIVYLSATIDEDAWAYERANKVNGIHFSELAAPKLGCVHYAGIEKIQKFDKRGGVH